MDTNSTLPPGGNRRSDPESFRARSIEASLTVKDLDKSLAWYRDVVGFTVDREYERGGKRMAVALKAGAVRILLAQDDGSKGWDRPKGEGFSLQFTTAQNIDAIAARILSRGGSLEAGPADTRWGARILRLKDPDGFMLVVSSGNTLTTPTN